MPMLSWQCFLLMVFFSFYHQILCLHHCCIYYDVIQMCIMKRGVTDALVQHVSITFFLTYVWITSKYPAAVPEGSNLTLTRYLFMFFRLPISIYSHISWERDESYEH